MQVKYVNAQNVWPSVPRFYSLILTFFLDDLKIALAAEAKSWKVVYGRHMNSKYQKLMDKVMEQIEDLSKRLARPVKDLDDVRQAMTTLKEIREHETYIDSTLGPVEVCDACMTLALIRNAASTEVSM